MGGLCWVSSEELEGVIEGVYYKYFIDTSGDVVGFYSEIDNVFVGEKLKGSSVVWANKQQIIDRYDGVVNSFYEINEV